MPLLIISCSSLLLVAAGQSTEDKLRAKFNSSLTNYASNRSMGVWIGVRSSSISLGFGTGYSCVADIGKGCPNGKSTLARDSDLIPSGSLTKSWTAASILRLVDSGVLRPTDRVAPLVNVFLNATNGTTLEELWGGGNRSSPNAKQIAKITVQQILHMNSGLQDYK